MGLLTNTLRLWSTKATGVEYIKHDSQLFQSVYCVVYRYTVIYSVIEYIVYSVIYIAVHRHSS